MTTYKESSLVQSVLIASTLNSIYFPIYQNQTGIVFLIEEEEEVQEEFDYFIAA